MFKYRWIMNAMASYASLPEKDKMFFKSKEDKIAYFESEFNRLFPD